MIYLEKLIPNGVFPMTNRFLKKKKLAKQLVLPLQIPISVQKKNTAKNNTGNKYARANQKVVKEKTTNASKAEGLSCKIQSRILIAYTHFFLELLSLTVINFPKDNLFMCSIPRYLECLRTIDALHMVSSGNF